MADGNVDTSLVHHCACWTYKLCMCIDNDNGKPKTKHTMQSPCRATATMVSKCKLV